MFELTITLTLLNTDVKNYHIKTLLLNIKELKP